MKDSRDTTTPSAEIAGFGERATAYLARVVEQDTSKYSSRDKVWSAVAELAVEGRGASEDPVDLTVEDLDTITERFATFTDTTDFDMIALLNLWYRSDRGELLESATRQHIRSLILDFKYWYDEPQPEGIIDERWYWSENHQILFHTIEYLAGQAFPDDTFTNDGSTGEEHMAHAEPLIERWVDQRGRFGFSEWYSNVYYGEDLDATLALAEFAADERLSTLGAIVTDLVLYDMAGHTHRGAFGATHGRSYKKDKMSALDEDTWDVSKLVFDDTTEPFQSALGAVGFASAQRYRPPAVLGAVVADDGSDDGSGVVERARHSLPIDPLSEVSDAPGSAGGLAFDDPDNLMTWWGMGALTPWQTVVETTNEMTRYNLWATELFAPFKPFESIIKASDPDTVRTLARSLAPQLNIGLLSEANTYTWRSDDAMLSTAQDFRKGQASQQHHVWQATLTPEAQVFTTHPRTPTVAGESWHSNSEDWTGNASLPRSAQSRNVNISIYAPLFASSDVLQGSYEPLTHAYFPQDHFDEVVSAGHWTFGRVGTSYVAVYSWRPTRWAKYDPATTDVNGLDQPFELVADGGPNNVWITELGSESMSGSFDEFRESIEKSDPEVEPLGDPAVYSTAFDVTWRSPSLGEMTFGWDEPLFVDGTAQSLHAYPRIDSPWAQVDFDTRTYDVSAGGHRLQLDLSKGRRVSV